MLLRRIINRLLPPPGRVVPEDALVVPSGQSIYDPAVFGTYDLASQRVIPRTDPTASAFSLDLAVSKGQRQRANSKTQLHIDRYRLVLDLLEPGVGVCLDACTASPLPEVKGEVERKGYDYLPIDRGEAPGIRKEDLTKLSFADNSVSRILSLDTLEHIPDYEAAAREIYRVLQPDGFAYMHVPVYYFDKPHGEPIRPGVDPWDHIRYFSARELLEMFDRIGFAILRAHFNFDYGALLAVMAKPARTVSSRVEPS